MAWTSAILGAALVFFTLSSALGSEAGGVFPVIKGKALTGDSVQVPDDLAGDLNLIVVAFQREQQEDVDTWIPGAESLEKSVDSLRFYEFPVLPEMNSVSKWFIYRGMRSGITSERARERTVTFHLDKEQFRRDLGIESEDYISVFLVDSEGALIWRGLGEWSQEKEDSLRRALLDTAPPGKRE
jgi:hypothetical protein